MPPEAATTLLTPGDPAPFTLVNEGGRAKCLLVADHAGNAVPEKLDNLGLGPAGLRHHAAYDIGVAYVARRLAAVLDAPAIMGNISRLVVDLNRRTDHPTAFAANAEENPVPGNLNLTAQDRAARIAEIYDPFDAEIGRLLDGFSARNIVPAIISLHSFTRFFYGQERPWDIGFLWVQDGRLALPLIAYFERKGYNVGNNQPYDARILRGTTLARHADPRRFPNVLVEFGNDRIGAEESAEEWIAMLADALRPVLAEGAVHTLYDGPDAPAPDPEQEKHYFDELKERARRGK